MGKVKAAGLLEQEECIPKFAFSIVLMRDETTGVNEAGFKLEGRDDLIYRMVCDIKNQIETLRIIEGLRYASVDTNREEES